MFFFCYCSSRKSHFPHFSVKCYSNFSIIFFSSSFLGDCIDPTCSNHGTCINGQCFCKAGWQGEDCSTVDQQVYQCLPGCSERGTYDLETGTCICDRHWTGPDCSQGIFLCNSPLVKKSHKLFLLLASLSILNWISSAFFRSKGEFLRFWNRI